jgi:hypothetical protein
MANTDRESRRYAGHDTVLKLNTASARKTPRRPKTPPDEPAVTTQLVLTSDTKPPANAASQKTAAYEQNPA